MRCEICARIVGGAFGWLFAGMQFSDTAWPLVAVVVVVMAVLWERNEYADRRNILLLLPVLVQQLGQALLWPHLAARDTDGAWLDPALHNCSSANRSYTLLTAAAVLGSLFWIEYNVHAELVLIQYKLAKGVAPRFARKFHPAALTHYVNVRRKRTAMHFWLWAVAIGALCYFSFLSAAPRFPRFSADSEPVAARCSSRGSHGFQVWSFLVWPNLKISFGLMACFLSFSGGLQVMPRPSVFPFIMTTLMALVPPMMLMLGEEWGSAWCSLVSCSALAYLFEPYCVKRLAVVDPTISTTSSESPSAGSRGRPTDVDHLMHTVLWGRIDSILCGSDWASRKEEQGVRESDRSLIEHDRGTEQQSELSTPVGLTSAPGNIV